VLEQSRKSADIVLQVVGEGVLVHRQDPLFLRLQIVSPHVAFDDIPRVFPEVNISIARFHTHLNFESPSQLYTNQVDFKLHVLRPADARIRWLESEPLREVGEEIVFNDGQATILTPEAGLDHAVMLTNAPDKDLFPYFFWLDTATYSITLMYATQNDDDPPLRKLGAPPIPEGEKPENFQGEDTESTNADEKEEERPSVPGVL
jgi:hypothetical protein